MSDVLQEIIARKRKDVEEAKKHVSVDSFSERIAQMSPPRGFRDALLRCADKGDFAVIAEMKRASPSSNRLRDYEPSPLATGYQQAGAACLSVLTEAHFFKGTLADLVQARDACALPVLRKDFIIDVWQVAESRAYGADAVLLIMAALSPAQAQELYDAARQWQMDVLVEVHDEKDMEKALRLAPNLLGINNRNLHTLGVDLQTTESLAKHVPKDCVLVSESGIRNNSDLCQLRTWGAQAFLIGTHLMRADDASDALKRLLKP